ncbi:MAG: site-specific integrase, partial [Myxococcota bacterium]|nr:site-specific integrase [Myxococcota bacterium]
MALDITLPPGISGSIDPRSKRIRLKWRNRIQQPDGSIVSRQRSVTVANRSEVSARALQIDAALREHGHYDPGATPFRLADEDLEEVFVAYLRHKRVFDRQAENTLQNIAAAVGRFTRGVRNLLGLTEHDMIPAGVLHLDLYRECVCWAATEGQLDGQAYSAGTVYQTAFIILQAWTWAADETIRGKARWPTLPNPPYNRAARLPPRPIYVAPSDVGHWAELDAVLNDIQSTKPPEKVPNVRMAFWCCVIQRYTGLRLFQAAGIHREHIDVDGSTLLVVRGKSKREKALNRRMAVSPHLIRDLAPLLAQVRSGPLFPDSKIHNQPVRHYRNGTSYVTDAWRRTISEGRSRPTVVHPPGRHQRRPNHAFRGALLQALEDGGVRASVIDWLVGHAPADTRARHYTRANLQNQQAAV